MIQQLKEKFGPKCSGIKTNANLEQVFVNDPVKRLRFCEALHYSFDLPLVIHQGNISQYGARRIFQRVSRPQNMIKQVAARHDMPITEVTTSLKKLPKVPFRIKNIVMGITEEMEEVLAPDVYLLYLKQDRWLTALNLKRIENAFFPICSEVFTNCLGGTSIICHYSPHLPVQSGLASDEIVIGIRAAHATQLISV
ncbi:MAG: hypothetical protein ACNS62_07575 [Candidatus Cyclobacteriaceae bacterium M3_2C_046]